MFFMTRALVELSRWAAVKMSRLVRSRALVVQPRQGGDQLQEHPHEHLVGVAGHGHLGEVW
jgi:hypothetical protein